MLNIVYDPISLFFLRAIEAETQDEPSSHLDGTFKCCGGVACADVAMTALASHGDTLLERCFVFNLRISSNFSPLLSDKIKFGDSKKFIRGTVMMIQHGMAEASSLHHLDPLTFHQTGSVSSMGHLKPKCWRTDGRLQPWNPSTAAEAVGRKLLF